MRTYFSERRSKREMVAMPSVTQPKPARNPAVAPQLALVLGSARKAARLMAITSAKTKARLKIFAMFDFARSSWFSWLTDIQARPKSAGEYQSPPSTNVEIAAASTASQLMCGIEPSSRVKFHLQDDNARLRGTPYCKKFPSVEVDVEREFAVISLVFS